jgi:hypothetical protein
MALLDRYDHEYPACSRTYATLCIYHDSEDPLKISEILHMNPDRSHKFGDLLPSGKIAPVTGWFLSTKDVLTSKDLRAHVEWLIDRLHFKRDELHRMTESGYRMWIYCFWASSSGNGGPVFDRQFIQSLSDFPFELHLDIWFDSTTK